ncbi:carboxypeptidase-like regulatory domain-containing protein [Leeuwenhoekiella sp. A16]|uniref:carboxypeptidase-like regulatory domain-containing protein n=1 Tax=unclassified Leeuwenhoekiella TaxID=2615029 RepID=UPI003A803E97|tara:strand:- start:199522 stop:200292 length:771 start_codon:yes stop_codon:yes gene_type:complete
MRKALFAFIFLITPLLIFAQDIDDDETISGQVVNASNDAVLDNVNIINLNNVKGAISDEKGNFTIQAKVNDTLFFSFLGFKTLQVRVTNDWKKFGDVKVKMTEVGIALEEVVVKDVELTGYLEIDAKNVPVYKNVRYSISGLPSGYEAGQSQPSAINKVLSAVFNPADFLYNVFGKKPQQMRKLRQVKEDDKIRNLLVNKFDRETLTALLQITKEDIDEILRRCDYSESFVKTANDLQILDAVSSCYEEYKVLHRD